VNSDYYRKDAILQANGNDLTENKKRRWCVHTTFFWHQQVISFIL